MNKTIVKGIIVVLVIICFGLALCDFLVSSKDISNNNSNSNTESNSNIDSNSNIESNSNSNVVEVTGIKISSSKQTIEEDGSFKLTAIVLPNEATNKNIRWTSSNEKIATVDGNGLVSAKSAGTVKINAITLDGNKSVSCEITVTKKVNPNHVVLSDISGEKKQIEPLLHKTIEKEFQTKVYNDNFDLIVSDEVYEKEYKLFEEKEEKYDTEKRKILDSLIDNKKSFILLIKLPMCGASNTFKKVDSAKKILDSNNIDYFMLEYASNDGLIGSKIGSQSGKNEEKISFAMIFKDGKIYAYADESKYSFNNDKDVKNWLSKYIDIK